MRIAFLVLVIIATCTSALAQNAASQGRALELNVNSGVTEDQAVALAKAAMD